MTLKGVPAFTMVRPSGLVTLTRLMGGRRDPHGISQFESFA
jgi:hypothetical protein